MIDIFRGYIQTRNKAAVQKYGNGEPLLTFEQLEGLEEGAGVQNGLYAVVDIDDQKQAKAFFRLIKALNLNCRVYKTTRGAHFVFAVSEYVKKPASHEVNALGLEFDTRAGENSYILVKQNGQMRKILRDFDESRPIDVFPKLFAAVKGAKPLFGLVDGEGRNPALFNHVRLLAKSGYSRDEAREAARLINEHVFSEPLPDTELETILRDETFSKYAERGYKAEQEAPKLNIIRLSDVKSQPVHWLWKPYLPLGKIVLLQGEPGAGKTMLGLVIAAMLASGNPFFGEQSTKRPASPVIYQTAEDGLADTIKPRLEWIDSDTNFVNICVIDETEHGLSLSDARIEAALKEIHPRLFVIDPFQAYLGADVDMHRANEVRPVLARIGVLAELYGCTFLFIAHPPKGATRALYASLGTVDIPAVSRSILTVGTNPADTGQRILAHVKSSLAPLGGSLAFRIDPRSGFIWEGSSSLSADDLLADKRGRGKSSVTLDAATEFLQSHLEGQGYVDYADILNAADENGIKPATLYRAKKELGILSRTTGKKGQKSVTYWFRPETVIAPP